MTGSVTLEEPLSMTAHTSIDLAASQASASRRPLKVALFGFGTVGASVARILADRTELGGRIQLTHVFNRSVARKRVDWVPESVNWTQSVEDALASRPDVVVEVMGGVQDAYTIVRRALEQGASVVTANKMLLATHGPELLRLAGERGAQIRFEAAVGGGVPLIHGVREGLSGDTLTGVAGILNGTCNYILSRMSDTDEAMGVVLKDAQKLGYAEADPTADVDGFDAAAKLVVLAGIAFRRHMQLDDIPRGTIRTISSADFRYARRLGCTIRQLSQMHEHAGHFYASVGPALVPGGSSFGRNLGANNVVTIYGKYGGESAFSGAGAGGPATAVAVVSDLLALTQRSGPEAEIWEPVGLGEPPARPYYLRFIVRDRPGILAAIATALAGEHVNLDAVLQEPGYPKDALPFVITVEPCEESSLRRALARISAEPWHAEPPLALPMLMDDNS
jgi:homoserine dehydrogenase